MDGYAVVATHLPECLVEPLLQHVLDRRSQPVDVRPGRLEGSDWAALLDAAARLSLDKARESGPLRCVLFRHHESGGNGGFRLKTVGRGEIGMVGWQVGCPADRGKGYAADS